jgi:CRISPR-associated protein Cas2
MFVVVAYDIADDKRRLKLMKALQGYGAHVQESVFECDLDEATYRKMVTHLGQLINPKNDNLRLYHLCAMDIGRIEELGVGRAVQVMKEFSII